MDMVDRVARAIAASDEANPPIACACSGKESPEDFDCSCRMFDARRRARAAIEAMHGADLYTQESIESMGVVALSPAALRAVARTFSALADDLEPLVPSPPLGEE